MWNKVTNTWNCYVNKIIVFFIERYCKFIKTTILLFIWLYKCNLIETFLEKYVIFHFFSSFSTTTSLFWFKWDENLSVFLKNIYTINDMNLFFSFQTIFVSITVIDVLCRCHCVFFERKSFHMQNTWKVNRYTLIVLIVLRKSREKKHIKWKYSLYPSPYCHVAVDFRTVVIVKGIRCAHVKCNFRNPIEGNVYFWMGYKYWDHKKISLAQAMCTCNKRLLSNVLLNGLCANEDGREFGVCVICYKRLWLWYWLNSIFSSISFDLKN